MAQGELPAASSQCSIDGKETVDFPSKSLINFMLHRKSGNSDDVGDNAGPAFSFLFSVLFFVAPWYWLQF